MLGVGGSWGSRPGRLKIEPGSLNSGHSHHLTKLMKIRWLLPVDQDCQDPPTGQEGQGQPVILTRPDGSEVIFDNNISSRPHHTGNWDLLRRELDIRIICRGEGSCLESR